MGSSYYITYGGNRVTFPGTPGPVAWWPSDSPQTSTNYSAFASAQKVITLTQISAGGGGSVSPRSTDGSTGTTTARFRWYYRPEDIGNSVSITAYNTVAASSTRATCYWMSGDGFNLDVIASANNAYLTAQCTIDIPDGISDFVLCFSAVSIKGIWKTKPSSVSDFNVTVQGGGAVWPYPYRPTSENISASASASSYWDGSTYISSYNSGNMVSGQYSSGSASSLTVAGVNPNIAGTALSSVSSFLTGNSVFKPFVLDFPTTAYQSSYVLTSSASSSAGPY